jgi:serine/threonine protein kinase
MDTCATPEQLVKFLRDQLDGPEREIIAAHVEDCLACQQALDQLTRSPVVRGVRATDQNRNGGDSQIVARLKAKTPPFFEEEIKEVRPSEPDERGRQADGSSTDMNDVDRSARHPCQSPSITGFKIIREIGRGGMGVVYEAEEELLSRRVALKLLPASALHHPKQVERFRREAKAAARLHHTNIVPVFGVGEQAGHPYYVMQYIDGRGLDKVLKELRLLKQDGSSPRPSAVIQPPDGQAPRVAGDGQSVQAPPSITAAQMARLIASGGFEEPGSPTAEGHSTEAGESETATLAPPIVPANHSPIGPSHLVLSNFSRPYFQSVARIGIQVAEALEHANRQGVLHRDIKPSNLLLDTEGSVRVTDFGLAKMTDSDDLTDTGDLVGTLRYMAPERFQGQCDARSDVFSLGLTLYELVALRPAYEAPDRHELIEKVLHEEPIRLDRLASRIPRDLDTIIQKAIAREPVRRYATAAALADDLRRFLEGRPIAARPVGVAERLWLWGRRSPKLAAVSTLLTATVLIAVSAFFGLTYWHNVQLRAEVKRTEDNAAEASRNAAESRRNYQEARSTIQAMLARANDHRLAGSPKLLDLRHSLQEDARGFYDRILAKIDANDPVVRADTANAFAEASMLESHLGHPEEAEKLIRRALELIQSARADRPEEFEYLGIHVICLLRLTGLLMSTGRADKAVETGQETVQKAELLAKKAAPDDLSRQELVAVCLEMYGNTLWALKRFADARVPYRKGIEIRERIDPAKLPGVTSRLAGSLMNEGVMFCSEQRIDEAEASFRRAEERLQSMSQNEHVAAEDFVSRLSQLYMNWGGMLCNAKRFEEALARVDQGLNLLGPHRRSEPNDAGARQTCLELHGNRGLALSGLGKHHESIDEWKQVIELSREPVPAYHRIQLAMELVKAGEHAGASAQARLVQAARDLSGLDRYNLGALFAVCAAAARNDPSVLPDKRSRLVDSHISDALHEFRNAAEAGFFRDPAMLDQVKKDPDVEILRDRPEFRRLIEPPAAKPANKGK